MPRVLFALACLCAALAAWSARADVVISQYIEPNGTSAPRGIEVWNSGASAVNFAATPLTVWQSSNGASIVDLGGATTVTSGSLAAGAVLVMGSTDVGAYLTATFGADVIRFVEITNFIFNGDDALQLRVNGAITDNIGTPDNDPGTQWAGGGVSTLNQNIALLSGITTGSLGGWTDPSTRFSTVSTNNSLTGFGLAPAAVPEASAFLAGGLICCVIGLWSLRRRRLVEEAVI